MDNVIFKGMGIVGYSAQHDYECIVIADCGDCGSHCLEVLA